MAKLPCPAELWPAFSALLDAALDLPEVERPRWLASLGPEHAAVRPWLSKVINTTSLSAGTAFLSGPPVDAATSSGFSNGQQVGPYRLEKPLGVGGMGEVWLADRTDGTLSRKVALKLPHVHLMAGALRRRFERERDILAGLSHPHIAQLYDAGVADAQYPYFAMEYIDGIAINEHCSASACSLAGRLDLFLQVLDAVGYAHERLVAHRDLKPSNILVTRDGTVKLLDFGIAKLVDDTESGATQLTRIGSCMATPAYAAPEQLLGAPVTASVDLYALGIILYELLSGERPSRDRRNGPAARSDIPRASSQVSAAHAKYVGSLTVAQLRRALAGDLDAIINKALEFDPARRYHTAEAFAKDIEQSRQHRPISARQLSPATLTLKFIRRHSLGVGMSVGLVLVLIIASGVIAWQAFRAEREAQRATTIKDFLVDVFRANDPRIATDKPRGEITIRELFDISAGRIESSFTQHPDTQIELLGITADIYRELDETQRSSALYARENELATRLHGAASAFAIDGLLGQANNADHDGDDARALALLAQADPLIRQARLDNSPFRARWLLTRGEALMGEPAATAEQAKTSLVAAAGLFKTVAPKDSHYPDSLVDLGTWSMERAQFEPSAEYYRQAISVTEPSQRLEGDLLLAYAGLALDNTYLGRFDEATAAFAQGTNIAERAYGRDSRHYWLIQSDWAKFRYERGERTAALAAFESLLQNVPDQAHGYRNGSDAVEAAEVLRKYGHCLADDGQGPRAIELLEKARTILHKSAQHLPDLATLQLDLGNAYAAGGRVEEARSAFLDALRTLDLQHAPKWQLANAHERLGRFMLSQGENDGALAHFNQALLASESHNRAAAIYARAGMAAIAVARDDAAAALHISALAMAELGHLEQGYDIRIQPYVWRIRAQALRLGGDGETAHALASRTYDADRRYYAPDSAEVKQAETLLLSRTQSASLR